MILTVPTGPCLAKNSPRLSSEMFCGRLDLFVSRRCTGSTYDEQVGGLESAICDGLWLTSASARARAAGACSQAVQVSFIKSIEQQDTPAKAVTEDPSTADVSMRRMPAWSTHSLPCCLVYLRAAADCWIDK